MPLQDKTAERMLNNVTDFIAATQAKPDQRAWDQLLIYCPREILERRFINCEACQTEGRVLTNDGGPDDIDHGACPECNGERVVEIEVKPITIEDLD